MHRYTDPWAWGADVGIKWWPADATDPQVTLEQVADVLRRRPDTIAIIRYDDNRPSESLAAHCAIAMAPVMRMPMSELTQHVMVSPDAIWEACAELIDASGNPDAILALPYPVWSPLTYHAWMIRDFESNLGIPRRSLAMAPELHGRGPALAELILSALTAHVIPRAR
jgi:hypothetical protein